MSNIVKWLLIVLGGLALICVLAALVGLWRFGADSQRARDRLSQLATPPQADAARLARLPPMVRRYLQLALPYPMPPLRLAHVEMSGSLRSRSGASWHKFTAQQVWSLSPPGFVWTAQVRPFPLVRLEVRDMLRNRRGSLIAMLYGWVPLAQADGPPELGLGDLQRWLAEAVIFPSALLPGPHLKWEAAGDNSAWALLTGPGLELGGVFVFGRDGLPQRFETPGRPRQMPDGSFEPYPWLVRYSDWRRARGFLVPHQAEVAWVLEGEEFVCLRLEWSKVRYE